MAAAVSDRTFPVIFEDTRTVAVLAERQVWSMVPATIYPEEATWRKVICFIPIFGLIASYFQKRSLDRKIEAQPILGVDVFLLKLKEEYFRIDLINIGLWVGASEAVSLIQMELLPLAIATIAAVFGTYVSRKADANHERMLEAGRALAERCQVHV